MQQTTESHDPEYQKIIRNFRLAVALSVVVIGVGTVFYHYVEDLRWVDAIYLCVITLTTVGYGDITPQTDIGKIFTVFYILIGIGIIATLANLIIKRAVAARRFK